MENVSIKVRLIVLVSLLIGIMIGIGYFGMTSTHNIISHMEADAHKEQDLAHTLELSEQTEIVFKSQIVAWKNILIRGNSATQYKKHKKQFEKYSGIVQENLKKLENKYNNLGIDIAEVKYLFNLHQALNTKYMTALEQFNKNNPETGKYVDGLVKDIEQPVDSAFQKMIHHLSEEIDNVVEASETYAAEIEVSTRNIDLVIIVGGSLFGLLLGWLLIRSIVKPLEQIIRVTQQLAQGDMTANVNVTGKSEISKLQHSLSVMTDKLRSVVKQVHNGANSVSISSDEIAQGSLDLSSRTEEQAASIEETSSTMEYITETVKQNSNAAKQALQLSSKATEKAEHGLEVAKTAVTAINDIKSSSEKVADIIGVIDEIAFQTNILALNASIEAERAGEQGRGFSVVANEVQKLAQRSADAANEIKALIKSSTEKVHEGTEYVINSSQSLEEIVTTSNETNHLMQQISEASQEQASSLSQVNTAVGQLEETTQQNAALVEQTSAASTSMSDQARNLTKLVSFFKFENESSDPTLVNDTHLDDVPTSKTQRAPLKHTPATATGKPTQKIKKPVGNMVLQPESGTSEWEEF